MQANHICFDGFGGNLYYLVFFSSQFSMKTQKYIVLKVKFTKTLPVLVLGPLWDYIIIDDFLPN